MPGIPGWKHWQKSKNTIPQIPVVLITKNETENLMDEAIGSQIIRLPDKAGKSKPGLALA